jgi:hypothetical protein
MRAAEVTLSPSPIYPEWVLEGKPVARNHVSDKGFHKRRFVEALLAQRIALCAIQLGF